MKIDEKKEGPMGFYYFTPPETAQQIAPPRRPNKLIFYIRALTGNREEIDTKKDILSTRENREKKNKKKKRRKKGKMTEKKQKCKKMQENERTCQNMSEHVRTCQNMSERERE